MSTHKHIDKICFAAALLSFVLCILVMNFEPLGVQASAVTLGYEQRLFDTSEVHSIDIIIDDWDAFLDTAQSEEYTICDLVIDGETVSNVGIRGKGNTSLSSVASMGSERYSFKIEFDHYDSSESYHGLDKLCLNNLIQDTTYMKDYLTYQLMQEFGAAAPLCSYAYITVNGEDWGLYLAVEAIEEAFLQRNYGSSYGQLYKPDSLNMGGGGGGFEMPDFGDFDASDFTEIPDNSTDTGFDGFEMPDMGDFGNFGGMGSSDAKLQYVDDDPDSYSTIFDSAKTDPDDQDKARLIESLKALSEGNVEDCLDIDAVLRYFVVHNFVVNGDSYTGSMVHNYYLYEDEGILTMLPWDYNLAFGTFQGNSANDAVNDSIDAPLSVTGDGSRPMVDWIFQSEEYTELYHQYFAEFLDTVDVDAIIAETAAMIAPYVEQDPTAFYSYEEHETGVAVLREFCQLRMESIRSQLEGTDETVEASHLNLSDMGSMNTGGGGDRGGRGGEKAFSKGDDTASFAPADNQEAPSKDASEPPEGFQMPEGMDIPGGMEMPENFQMPDGFQLSEDAEPSDDSETAENTDPAQPDGQTDNAPDQPGSFSPPGDMANFGSNSPGDQPQGSDSGNATVILLAVSVLFLCFGLVVAFLFKR